MRPRSLRRFDELVDDERRCRSIGIPHPEIDNVFAPFACCSLKLTRNVEYICRQTCQPSKLFHLAPRFLLTISRTPEEWACCFFPGA